MATTSIEYTGDGNATKQFTFPSLQESDVKVRVDGVLKSTGTHYNITSYTTTGGGNVVFTSGNIPSSPANIRIYRDTNVDTAKATFTAGSSVKAADLNNNTNQLLFKAQEEIIQSYNIDIGAIEVSNIAADAVDGTKIADDSINSEHYAAGSIDLEHMSANSVDSDQYVDGSIDRVHLAADIVDGTKIADDSINSEHYVDLSIDTQHIANENITTAKIANLNVTTGKLADLNVTTLKIADLAITTGKIADGAITDDKIQGGSLDNRYYTETELDAGQLDNRYFTETELTNGALDGRYFTETEADARYFNVSTGDTIKDGDTFPDNDTTIATTAAINDRIIDLVDDVGGFVPIANETSFPTSNPDVNGGAGTIVSIQAASTNLVPSSTTVTIANGRGSGLPVVITGVSETIAAGFGFLVETTTTDHTYAFHRLSPKATEVTTVAGIASNVTTVAGISANTTTVAGIAGNVTTVAGIASNVTSVANNESNINSAVSNASNINSAVSNAANITTVAGSISNVNNVGGSIASVNTAASNLTSINNFGDTYQVASSNPSTDGGGNALAEGDLYFNTTANELKVYNGGAWQGGVTASGNFASTTGNSFSGDNTYADNAKARFGTGQDLEIFHNGNDSIINDTGDGTLKIQTGGNTKLEIQSSGIGVTGNITISGNVDGRDVAADGTSLDNIEAGNIGTDVTNGNVKLTPNGTGAVEIKGAGGNDGTLQLNCSVNSHGVKIKSPPHSAAATYTLTLPSNIVDGQFLKTDSSGNLSWASSDLSADTTPQLGGNLDLNGSTVNGTGNISISGNLSGNALTLNNNNLTINGTQPNINFVDSDGNPDYEIKVQGGTFDIRDSTSSASRFNINSSGVVSSQGEFHCESGLDTNGDVLLNSGTTNVNIHFDASTSTMNFSDSMALSFGDHSTTGDYNLSYVNGSDFTISAMSGGLGDLIIGRYENAATKKHIVSTRAGVAELYHDDSKKLNTAAGGIDVTGNITVTGTVDGKDISALGISGNTLSDGVTATTQSASDNSTKVATTAYTDTAISNLVDSSPSALNTLNELAAALGDDANFSTTVTNSIATKLPLAGGTLTGDITLNDTVKAKFGTGSDLEIYHDGSNSVIKDSGEGNLQINLSGLRINNAANSEKILHANEDGAVELYHDDSKKLETTSTGVSVTGALVASGDITAFSDLRLKTDIHTINNALDTVGKLRGVNYKWLNDGKQSTGLIAQEVEKVIPEVVITHPYLPVGDLKEVKAIDYGKLVGVLIEAVKELKTELDAHKAEVAVHDGGE